MINGWGVENSCLDICNVMGLMAAESIIATLNGEKPPNIVNLEIYEYGGRWSDVN